MTYEPDSPRVPCKYCDAMIKYDSCANYPEIALEPPCGCNAWRDVNGYTYSRTTKNAPKYSHHSHSHEPMEEKS